MIDYKYDEDKALKELKSYGFKTEIYSGPDLWSGRLLYEKITDWFWLRHIFKDCWTD